MTERTAENLSAPFQRMGENLRRFGAFELDTRTGELRKYGARIKLADQPFRILVALLEQPGDLVTREQLRERIWPGDAAGDFEQGLNRAVSKLRDALSDRAVNPRFIETLPARGYRFIGTLQVQREETVQDKPQTRRFVVVSLTVLLLLVFVAGAAKLLVPSPIGPLRWRKLTTDSYVKAPPVLSDGTRIYFSASFEGEQFIAQVPISGGHPARLSITPPAPGFILHDLSPDGQELLLTAAAKYDRLHLMPLWSLRVADGSARRLGTIVATSAAYAPSGNTIAYSTPTELWIALADGSRPRRLLEVKESFIGSICWSPDGTRIRFSRSDPVSNYATPWEIKADGSGLRSLSPTSSSVSQIPAGWALDGQLEVFFAGGSFWARSEALLPLHWNSRPLERLAEDAPEFEGSIRIRNRNLFHAVGTDRLSELQRFDTSRGTWTPLLEGISAEAVEYSPDGQHVAYITYPQRTLWVRQADGGRPMQLTSPPLVASNPRWSPDAKSIAFSGSEADDKPMRLYIVDTDGGQIKPAVPSALGSQGYPTWSPDGKRLLYGIVTTSLREEVYIRVADLETGKVTKLPGSEGLFAPRWSPDGHMIAALRFMGDRTLMIQSVGDKHWQEVPGRRVDWPAWLPDSKSILCKSGNLIINYRLDSGKFKILTTLKPEELGGYSRWIGTSFDGSPLRTLNRDSRQIYALQVEGK
jgi:Tol biopolymer transport system component/DNA-binding winged helix-turn-helix (wHTH) protein